MPDYLLYRDDAGTVAPAEHDTFRKIADLILGGQHKLREGYVPPVSATGVRGRRVADPTPTDSGHTPKPVRDVARPSGTGATLGIVRVSAAGA